MSIFISSIGFGIVTAAILSLGAVGFTLQFGVTNVLNIAYGDVMILSAYVAYYVQSRWGINIWICLPIGGVVGAVTSYLLNRLIFSKFIDRGIGLFGIVIVTLAVGVMLENAILAVVGISFTSISVNSGPTYHLAGMVLSAAQLAIIGVAVVSMFVIRTMLVKTKLGKAMRATASNPWLARASGIHTKRVVNVAWLISGFLCGMAGICLAISIRTFQSSTGTSFLVVILAAAVLGGVGNPYGAMLGALVVGLSTNISGIYLGSNYSEAIAFIILVVFLVLRPTGILGRSQSSEKEFAT